MLKKTRQSPRPGTLHQRLKQWFATPLGHELKQVEQVRLQECLADLFGYHAVQLGTGAGHALESSRISHCVYASIDPADSGDEVDLIANVSDLPIESDSTDLLLLPHVLEFHPEPHRILREVERALIGEGHVVIVGFNPWSIWGLCRMMLSWWREPPWCGRFRGTLRVKDWLQLLGFDIVRSECFFHRPPIQAAGLLSRLGWMEKLGATCCPFLGGAYIIVGRKRVRTMIPIRTRWQARRRLIATGLIEPSTRNTDPCTRSASADEPELSARRT